MEVGIYDTMLKNPQASQHPELGDEDMKRPDRPVKIQNTAEAILWLG